MLVLVVAWALSVPILTAFAIRRWLTGNRRELPLFGSLLGLASLAVTMVSWLLFGFLAYCGQIGGLATHYVTLRASNTFFSITLFAATSCVSLKGPSRIFAALAGFLMAGLWAGAQLVA